LSKGRYRVANANNGKSIAFIVARKVARESKQEILPCLRSEHYRSILSDETKTVQIEADMHNVTEQTPQIEFTTYGSYQKQHTGIQEKKE